MKKSLLIALFSVGFLFVIHAQGVDGNAKMDFEAYDPPSSLVVPEHPMTKAKFPFIDVHSHHWRMGEMDLTKLIGEMDAMNMGLIVNLSGGGGQQLKGIMDNIKKYNYEDRIAVFTNINFGSISDPDWTESTLKQLEYDVSIGAKGLKIFKNLGFSVNDKDGKRVAVDDPRLDPIWAKCGELGIPVLIHTADPKQFWEPFDSTNERWLELKTHPRRKRGDTDPVSWEQLIQEQFNMFKKHPKTKFISAHMSWHANDLDKLGQLLDEMPNMYVEIGAVIAEFGRQPRQANKFFAKYQNRVMFGKDAYNPEEYHTYFRVLESSDEYFPYYKRYHAFWRMYGLALPDEVLKKLYYKNAMSVIPGLSGKQFPK
ncbi:MAG: amidohydrolase family protein [Saprospiraceae bacterium]|nr:amidohydrolase family protein [Saprospiraceae bacterium]